MKKENPNHAREIVDGYYIETDEERFQDYMFDMDLDPADFDKKILDVGSGSAQFAKYAREHHISDSIYSVDNRQLFHDGAELVVQAKAEELPFKDNEFDMVLSSYSIPIIYSGAEFKHDRRDIIKGSILEMLRVVEENGEVRFGLISSEADDQKEKDFLDVLNSVLDEIKDEYHFGVEICEKDRATGKKLLYKIKKTHRNLK